MSASITILSIPLEDPDSFREIFIDQRKSNSSGWKRFELRSGVFVDVFFLQALDTDLGVFKDDPMQEEDGTNLVTCMIDHATLVDVVPILEAMVEKNSAKTAHALQTRGGGSGDLTRITDALTSGTWPTTGDPAEEAAGFAHYLLKYARISIERKLGVCWEFRGDVTIKT